MKLNTMKKMAIAMISMMFAFAATADMNDATLLFSTRGPDRYADDTPVQVGEMYALVWVRNGHDFAGIDMNGRAIDAENSAVVVALPLAAKSKRHGGVRCPATLFQIDAAFAEAHEDGTFALALLDTRVSDGKGGLAPSGRLDQVKGWGLVENSRIKAVGGSMPQIATNLGGVDGTTSTTTASAVPAGEEIPQPRITGIKVENGFVRLTVAGTSPRLLYNVVAHDRPGHRVTRRAATALQGQARADREIEFIFPVTSNQKFFTVSQN